MLTDERMTGQWTASHEQQPCIKRQEVTEPHWQANLAITSTSKIQVI